MANEPSPLTPEQKKLWQWFQCTPQDLLTHYNGKEVQLLVSVPKKKKKELTPDHWDIIRRVHLQYSSFEGTSYTRQSFRSSDEKTFESVSKENAISIDFE